jgi:hypothetical protein
MPKENLHLEFLGIGVLIPPSIYYVMAGVFSFLSVKFISRVGSDQLVIDVLLLALIMLASQIGGLIIYHARLPVGIYNYTILIILALQILRLFLRREGDGVDRNSDIVFFSRRLTVSGVRNLC